LVARQRPAKIVRQVEHRWIVAQQLRPIVAARELALLGVVGAEPGRVVEVARLGPCERRAAHEREQIFEQHVDRDAVRNDVVHVEREVRDLAAAHEHGRAKQRRVVELERPHELAGGYADVAVVLVALELKLRRRGDLLDDLAFVKEERRAQRFVTRDERLARAFDRTDGQRAVDLVEQRQVVGRVERRALMDDVHPALNVGRGHRIDRGAARERAVRRLRSDRVGDLANRRASEHLLRGERDAELLADAREHLHHEQRVAAELEEAAGHADVIFGQR
jgi:hypothetical protein